MHSPMIKFALSLLMLLPLCGWAQYVPTESNLKAREEFEQSRFGIFIHWGLYAMMGQGEWVMTNQGINHQEYAKLMNAFYPHSFDAREWVSAIKDSGAKYITFTSRHHEGFSMWNTAQSDYNITNTPYGKDVIKQLADECHSQDVKLHLYYSHIDWTREDYPAGEVGKNTGKDSTKADWASYYRFMNNQLCELLTNYGKIDCIWFDGWWDHRNDSIPFNWQLEEQYKLIHTLQPACLIGNNHHVVPFDGEDIQIFERDIPGENKAGLSGQDIGRLPLETCQTMNGMWGYRIYDRNYKSVAQLVQLLVRTSGKGANLLLNIGPQPDGKLPQIALDRLKGMGEWLRKNGTTIYGTQAGPVYTDHYVTTQKGNNLWIHVLSPDVDTISIPLEGKIKQVVDFESHQPINYTFKKGVLTIANLKPSNTTDYIIQINKK